MKQMKLLIAAVAVLVACAGLAQIAPAEEAQTKAPPRGTMACRCAAGKQTTADAHLAKMSKCLGLSEDQKAKIKPILEENFTEKQAVRADKNLTKDQRRAKMQELGVKLHDQVKSLLTPEQSSKVAGMWKAAAKHCKGRRGHHKPGHHGKDFQMNPAQHLERMTSCLGLSAEQQTKIKPILEENYKVKQAVHADKNLTKEQRRTKMLELRGQLHEKIKPLLNPAQQKQFEAGKGSASNQPQGGNCPLMK